MKLIDRIKQHERTLEERLAQEAADAAEAQRRLDEEDRLEGRREAHKAIPEIDRKILNAVDEKYKVYRHPIARGRSVDLKPFEQGFAEYLIEHYQTEGIDASLEKMQLRRNNVLSGYDYNIHLSWLNK